MSSCVLRTAVVRISPAIGQFFRLQKIRTPQNVQRLSRTGYTAFFCTSWTNNSISSQDTTATEINKTDASIVDEANRKDMPYSHMEDPYRPEKEKCLLCKHNIEVDYKNVRLLSQFVSPQTGNIYPRHITGLCSYRQEEIIKNIQRSRKMGYMPVIYKETMFLKDPKITEDRGARRV